MTAPNFVRPDEKLPLKLTAAERRLVLEGLTDLDPELAQIVRDAPAGQPVQMTLDDWDDLGGYVAAEAEDCQDPSQGRKLDALYEKIQDFLDQFTFTDELPRQADQIEDAGQEDLAADQVGQILQYAALTLVVARQLGIHRQTLDGFRLAADQREILSALPGVTKTLKKKLAQEGATFSVGDVGNLMLALVSDLPDDDARRRTAALHVAEQLGDALQDWIQAHVQPEPPRKPRGRPRATDAVFQFKITLLGVRPPIWRRIQVRDGTLDALHEQIQAAMGWTNSHLHQFEVKGRTYGDPDLLEDGFEEFECADSTTTLLSQILPKSRKPFAFKYEYDFGDSWEHEILFEGRPPVDPQAKYPLCLEGRRACPPEDCGGAWGYGDFLVAIRDPQHAEHQNYVEWVGEQFDPEAFDPQQATQAMQQGLPDRKNTR